VELAPSGAGLVRLMVWRDDFKWNLRRAEQGWFGLWWCADFKWNSRRAELVGVD